jgi:hypothetical protein
MARHMGLDREQTEVLHHLKPGEAVYGIIIVQRTAA